jgi:hypothetical protein
MKKNPYFGTGKRKTRERKLGKGEKGQRRPPKRGKEKLT